MKHLKKNVKKALTITASAVVVLSLSVNVLAEKGNNTTTVSEENNTNTVDGSNVNYEPIVDSADVSGKEETVYIIQDADGSNRQVIVSDWLRNGKGVTSLDDISDLKDIVNVAGDETFTQGADGKVTWNADGSDIYYRGTTDKELPVDVKISYTLDGKAINANDLAGKSGHVTIRFDYTNNTSKKVLVNGHYENVKVPFAMISGVSLANEKFSNLTVTNGKIIADGKNSYVVGMAFPGLEESLNLSGDLKDKLGSYEIPEYVEIEADVQDFSLEMTMTVANADFLNELDVDTDGMDDMQADIDKLTDGANDLQDGAQQLKDGTGELVDGVNDLYDGTVTLKDGTGDLDDGADKLKDGTTKLKAGTTQLNSKTEGLPALAAGATQLSTGADGLAAGVEKVETGAAQLAAGTSALSSETAGIPALIDGIDQLYVGVVSGYTTTDESTGVETKHASLNQGIQQLNAALNTSDADQRITSLKDGAAGVNAGVQQLVGNVESSTESLGTLNRSLTDLVAGAENLYNSAEAGKTTKATENPEGAQALATAQENVKNARAAVTTAQENLNDAITEVENAANATTTNTVSSDKTKDGELQDLGTEQGEVQTVHVAQETDSDEEGGSDDSVGSEIQVRTDVRTVEQDYITTTTVTNSYDANAMTTAITNLKAAQTEYNNAVSDYDKAINAYNEAVAKNADLAVLADYADGAKQVYDGANAMKNQVNAQYTAATSDQSKASIAALTTGAQNLSNGIAELAGLVNDQLAPGSQNVANGITKLYTSVHAKNSAGMDLEESVAALNGGAQQLSNGISTSTKDSVSLKDGANALKTGAATVAAGAAKAADGAAQLDAGATDLANGADDLKDGTKKLKGGAGELLDGVVKLKDGAHDLDDGAQELLDGMIEFNDEGIKKLADIFGDDLTDVVDRLEALKDAGCSYNNFSGASEDEGNQVKFIFKTNAIEKKD